MKPTSKYFNQLILIIGFLSVLSGCNILDIEPADEISAEEAFKNKSDIEKGIIGSYSELQSLSYYGRTYLIFSDLAADNLEHPTDATSSDYAEVDNNAMLAENGAIEGIWSSIYSAINVDNSIIGKVPGISDMTDQEKAAALGELYFLRALNHFNLMNYFGAIPVKTEPTVGTENLDAGRDTTDKVFAQIISDLGYAESHLDPSTSLKTRATRFAATALLSRVYLYQKDYASAFEKANDVITNGGYTLMNNFADIFAADGSTETIFEVAFDEQDRNRIAEYNFPKSMNGRREVAPTQDLIDAYEIGDERMAATVAYNGSYAYANKYNNLSLGDDNVIILRLAEMYLIRAEAEAHLPGGVVGNVQTDINSVRNRVGLDDTGADTMNELLLAIENERRLEFAFEGHRWFDLVRTHRAIDILPNVIKSYQELFPIPLSELQTNNSPEMTQNPGY
jgi:starch-binding outer membrane protein, SusD/RagB family